MLILETRVEAWDSEADCALSARRLASSPCLSQAFIELEGDLGAGKTTFVRHLLRALGVTGTIKSPTYALMESYDLPGLGPVSHFDFYRFNDPQEWDDAGFRDVFAEPGLKLVEWPDQARERLPCPDLRLTLEALDHAAAQRRQVRWEACSARGVDLLPPAGTP
ncbi:MAG: tRNA (adenosine(37)-N6)-threonylcarbamoyltransferase complex ATPase subunit type 1 TsaE [Pseudomonadota bacterium]